MELRFIRDVVGLANVASLMASLLALILANTLFLETGLEIGVWFGNIKLYKASTRNHCWVFDNKKDNEKGSDKVNVHTGSTKLINSQPP